MPTLAVMTARNLEAAAIMAAAGDHVTAELIRSRYSAAAVRRWATAAGELRERAIPYHEFYKPHPEWREEVPAAPRLYLWRRGPDWESIEREVTRDGLTWSWRYWQRVPLAHIGGEWLHV